MRLLAAISVILIFTGCSTTALIHKKDGTVIKAEITRGDTTSLYLADDTAVSRVEIEHIDHPCEYHATIGGLIAAAGLGGGILGITFLTGSCDELCNLRDIVGWSVTGIGAISLVFGISFAVWGWSVHSSSVEAAGPKPSAGPKVSPVALSDGERTYWGLGMSWRW